MTDMVHALRQLLELLASGAPSERFALVPAAALAAGTSAAELAEIEQATELALAIRRTVSQHRQREAELVALFDTASDLAALRDVDAVLHSIVRRVRMLLRTDIAYLSLQDEAAADTYMRVTDGSVSALFQQLRLGMGEGLGGLVAQTRRPYATANYPQDSRFQHTHKIDTAVRDEGLVAIIGVPLKVGSRVSGVLFAADRSAREFSPEEVALLASLADHAAIAIDTARLLEDSHAAVAELNAANATIGAHNEAMRRAQEAHDRLTDLVLRGGDVPEMAAALAEVLGGGIVVHDADGAELASINAGPVPPPMHAVSASRATGRAVAKDDGWVCAVLAGAELLGSIVLVNPADQLSDADRRLFERASVVTALLLLLQRSAAEAENRVRGELVTDLLTSPDRDPAGLLARGRRLGVDLTAEHTVLVANAETSGRPRLAAAAARHADAARGLAGTYREQIVLVLPGNEPDQSARTAAVQLGDALGSPVTVGGAGPAAGPAALAAAHEDAERCLKALHALGRTGQGASAADLGFLGLLLGDRTDVSGYVTATLGPVLDYDAGRGTELIRTLRAYFDRGANLARTKEVLHVHVNTVVQRLDRIGALLGADWQSPARVLEIQLALRLHDLSTSKNGGDRGSPLG